MDGSHDNDDDNSARGIGIDAATLAEQRAILGVGAGADFLAQTPDPTGITNGTSDGERGEMPMIHVPRAQR